MLPYWHDYTALSSVHQDVASAFSSTFGSKLGMQYINITFLANGDNVINN